MKGGRGKGSGGRRGETGAGEGLHVEKMCLEEVSWNFFGITCCILSIGPQFISDLCMELFKE